MSEIPEDTKRLCEQAAAIMDAYGITIFLPWDGDHDDLELEQFTGLLNVVKHIQHAERERSAKIAIGFTVSAHIAHDMRLGNFPNRSEGRDAIAAMIRDPGHPYNPISAREA